MEHPDYFAEPFTRMGAWIDMLLMARHKAGYVRVRGVSLRIERGQIAVSQDNLAKRWKWGRQKVRQFIQELEQQNQIQVTQQKGKLINCISILNFDKYQLRQPTDDTMDEPIKEPIDDTTERLSKNHQKTNNKETMITNHTQSNTYQVTDKTRTRAREMLDWVARRFPEVAAMPKPFTEEQAVWLVRRYSEEDIMRIVADMDNKQATRNTSAYATFCSFAARDTVLKERREAQEKLYSYEEVCTAVSGGLRFDDFEITVVRRNGQNLWRRK